MDLNHQPLGYEFFKKRCFNKLAGVVAYLKEWTVAEKSVGELLFWVDFGLTFLGSIHIESNDRLRRHLNR